MAATIAVRAPGEGVNAWKVPGAYFDAIVEITGDGSYPLTATNGYPFGVAQLNTLTGGAFSMIESVDVVNPWMLTTAGAQAAAMAAFDKVHSSVRAYGSNGAAPALLQELPNAAATLNGLTCSLRVRAH